MADPTSIVPFWETLIASVVASGLLSSFLTTWYQRRKQNKRLQLDLIEKAMAMLRRHYSETESKAVEFLHSISSKEPIEGNR
jgi:type II secretory pathway component PulK